MYYRQVFVLLKCKLTNKIRNDKKSRPNCEEIKRHFSKIKRRFISLKRHFVRLKRRFVFLKNSNYLTLLPFPGDYFKVSFTRGDAYALPLSNCFWVFSPRVEQKVRNAKPKKHKSKSEAAREGKQHQANFALQGQKRLLSLRLRTKCSALKNMRASLNAL